jgi:excisionase family DNA binding protein
MWPEPRQHCFFTIEEVAKALKVDPRTVRRRIRDGTIRKVLMPGRLVRISSEELARLAGQSEEPAPRKRTRPRRKRRKRSIGYK